MIPLRLTIPYMGSKDRAVSEFDVSHLLHLGANRNNSKIKSRIPYLRSFCERANQYVDNGKSAKSVTVYYESFQSFITFCDAMKVNPFSETGYLKFVGNDGELRHRIKMYHSSNKLWERQHGEEIGIKESTAAIFASQLRTALIWSGLPADSWTTLHRGFSGEKTPFKSYSDSEEKLLTTRLCQLFFTLTPQLIAAKKKDLILPKKIPIVIDLGGRQEVISIPTSLQTQIQNQHGTSVKPSAAFNMVMGAAYHLMCFFTSLNDSDVQSIAHPISIHSNERDKSLKVVKVSSFKVRANKQVDALLTDESDNKFDLAKRDGVTFIKLLGELSELYGNGEKGSALLFTLNTKGERCETLRLNEINKHLTLQLNLLSPNRASTLPWLKELFYSYRNHHIITLKSVTNEFGRTLVNKVTHPSSKTATIRGATSAAYCILSCYTDLPLKGVLLPLSYSPKDSDGTSMFR